MADLNNTLVRGNLRVTDDANISGDISATNVQASTFNGYPLSGGVGNNTIPIRDNNGYVYFNYINTNVGQENPSSYSGVSLLFTGSDGWIRKSSPSNVSVGYADSAGSASSASALTTNAGSATNPVYFSGGVPVACTYSLNKTVPSDAIFTDHTYNFAGVYFESGNSDFGERNANNFTYNGVGWYTSNGPSTDLGATVSDGALYTQAYNSTWVAQIAQDYRNGRLFVRGKNSGSWTSWQRVALTGESQPANGGNADTLDGYDSSYFASASSLSNYLPLSGGTITTTNEDTPLTLHAEQSGPMIIASCYLGLSYGSTTAAIGVAFNQPTFIDTNNAHHKIMLSGDNISEFNNDSGYITGISSSDVTTALGYTPYNSSNPNGYITSSALSGYATQSWVQQQGYLSSIKTFRGDTVTGSGNYKNFGRIFIINHSNPVTFNYSGNETFLNSSFASNNETITITVSQLQVVGYESVICVYKDEIKDLDEMEVATPDSFDFLYTSQYSASQGAIRVGDIFKVAGGTYPDRVVTQIGTTGSNIKYTLKAIVPKKTYRHTVIFHFDNGLDYSYEYYSTSSSSTSVTTLRTMMANKFAPCITSGGNLGIVFQGTPGGDVHIIWTDSSGQVVDYSTSGYNIQSITSETITAI